MNVWLKMPCTKGAQYIFMKGMNKRYMYFGLYRSKTGLSEIIRWFVSEARVAHGNGFWSSLPLNIIHPSDKNGLMFILKSSPLLLSVPEVPVTLIAEVKLVSWAMLSHN